MVVACHVVSPGDEHMYDADVKVEPKPFLWYLGIALSIIKSYSPPP
jgi:hypothetical protein